MILSCVSYTRTKCLERGIKFFFFFSLATAIINTLLEKIHKIEDTHSTLKKNVWIQYCEELAEESNTIKILSSSLLPMLSSLKAKLG